MRREELQAKAVASAKATRELPSLEALAAKYPHVLVKIRASWRDPGAFNELMNDLLLQDRAGRAGFDPVVMMELTRLREYYTEVVAKSDGSAVPGPPTRPAP